MAPWLPKRTVQEITAFLESVTDQEFWEIYREIFKANASISMRTASKLCAQEGWFLDLEFPGGLSISHIIELITAGKAEDVWKHLEQYFEKRRPAIEVELTARFPARAKLLGSFFRLHDSHDYDVAIPIALIQADGICHDMFGAELFRSRKKKPAIREKIDAKSVDWVWDAAIEPLREVLPLARHQSPQSQIFNRHLILHGASLDYGTRRNSFRAMSLLSYLQSMAAYEDEARKRAKPAATTDR